MTTEKKSRFAVIKNEEMQRNLNLENTANNDYITNPMYQKFLQFRNLQEQQKKKFSVEDLFRLC